MDIIRGGHVIFNGTDFEISGTFRATRVGLGVPADSVAALTTQGQIHQSNEGFLSHIIFRIGGTCWGAGVGKGLDAQPTLNPAADAVSYTGQFGGVFNTAATGTHSLLAAIRGDVMTVNSGGATVTNTATLYVEGPMVTTVSGVNYSAWIAGGKTRIDGITSFGGVPSTAVQLYQLGTPGGDMRYAHRIDTILTPGANAESAGLAVYPDFTEPGSGTNGLLAGIDVEIGIIAGSANVTNADGINIRTFAARATTATASGLRVAAPTGGTVNHAINVVSGTVNIATGGSTSISSGTGTIKMTTANNADSAVWIPFSYDGTTYMVPGFATHAP